MIQRSIMENNKEDIQLIGLAAATCQALSTYIHGLAYGKTEALSEVDLQNAKDCFERLEKAHHAVR